MCSVHSAPAVPSLRCGPPGSNLQGALVGGHMLPTLLAAHRIESLLRAQGGEGAWSPSSVFVGFRVWGLGFRV